MLTEIEIINRGKIKDVVLTLDDGDMHSPSGHWANTSGTRIYSLGRVEIAESLINNFENGIYFHIDADEINKMILPVTKPYIIIDYRIIAKEIRYIYESSSRPYLPSFPGFEAYVKVRRPFVLLDLINIANYTYPKKNITNENELFKLMDEISESALKLFPTPWPNAIARIQVLKKHTFSGKSQNAALKILKIIALIKNNKISSDHLFKNTDDIFELLAAYPLLRIDHKIYNKIK
ncbi:MAG: hypothetical protein CFE21_06015 [Bacteroidetes bacterium B1(2017)]|nr:MAG: hypothetical protein CFE21_06015 [Bacteroidetes bacterium B1(2017)]